LRRELSFDRIPGVIEEVLSRAPMADLRDLAHVLEVDREARSVARSCLAELERLS
jgi:1-deoxy-D-xylulose 5-phosphate reductoisomerase